MTAAHPRLRSLLRLLLDAGEITPQGARQIERVLDAEDASGDITTCAWCDYRATGTSLHNDDLRYPSCGDPFHSRGFITEVDA